MIYQDIRDQLIRASIAFMNILIEHTLSLKLSTWNGTIEKHSLYDITNENCLQQSKLCLPILYVSMDRTKRACTWLNWFYEQLDRAYTKFCGFDMKRRTLQSIAYMKSPTRTVYNNFFLPHWKTELSESLISSIYSVWKVLRIYCQCFTEMIQKCKFLPRRKSLSEVLYKVFAVFVIFMQKTAFFRNNYIKGSGLWRSSYKRPQYLEFFILKTAVFGNFE